MDRRSFLKTSGLVGAAVTLAPNRLLAGAFAQTKRPVDDPWWKGWSPGMLFVRDLVCLGYNISDIAYCPTSPAQAEFANRVIFPRARKPFFGTLYSLILKELRSQLTFHPTLISERDQDYFLSAMPDPALAKYMISFHLHERMQATCREDLRRLDRLVDPRLPYFQGPNRDEVDCYAVYRMKTGLVDEADILWFGLTHLIPWDGIQVAIIEGPDIQPLYLAAARKLLGDDRALFVYRG